MIEITYKHHGSRPSHTDIIREDANAASILPSSFNIERVRYDDPEFVLLVDPPSDSISQESVNSIATSFSDRWGSKIDHVSTEKVER